MAQKVNVKEPVVAPEDYRPSEYTSNYEEKLNAALDTVTNWKYDPMKDASYQALAKVYAKRGNIAAKNTLADAAALNGGYGTSYAVSAAQQARNQYNQELAAMIPELENTAYNRAQGTLSAYRDADNTAYGRFRDTVGDNQWAYSQAYQKWRDSVGDYQWGTNFNYGIDRDAVSDSQWAQEFAYQQQRDAVADRQWEKQFALSKKGSSGGGGGRRSSGARSSGGGGSTSSGNPYAKDYPTGNDKKYSLVHQWDDKKKKIQDKTKAKEIKTYKGKGR